MKTVAYTALPLSTMFFIAAMAYAWWAAGIYLQDHRAQLCAYHPCYWEKQL